MVVEVIVMVGAIDPGDCRGHAVQGQAQSLGFF